MNRRVHSEQDPFPTCENEMPKKFSATKKQQQRKIHANGFKEIQGPSQAARLWQCCPRVSGFKVMKHTHMRKSVVEMFGTSEKRT